MVVLNWNKEEREKGVGEYSTQSSGGRVYQESVPIVSGWGCNVTTLIRFPELFHPCLCSGRCFPASVSVACEKLVNGCTAELVLSSRVKWCFLMLHGSYYNSVFQQKKKKKKKKLLDNQILLGVQSISLWQAPLLSYLLSVAAPKLHCWLWEPADPHVPSPLWERLRALAVVDRSILSLRATGLKAVSSYLLAYAYRVFCSWNR